MGILMSDAQLNRIADALERANYLAWQKQLLRYSDPTTEDLSFAAYVAEMADTPGSEYIRAYVNENINPPKPPEDDDRPYISEIV